MSEENHTEEQTNTPDPAPAENTPPETTEQQQPKENNDWAKRRLSEVAAQRRAAEERAREYENEIIKLKAERDNWRRQNMEGDQQIQQQVNRDYSHLPQEDIDAIVNQRVEQKLRDQTQQSDFDKRVGDLNVKAEKEFGTAYADSVQNLQAAGVGGREFLDVLTSVDNPEKLIVWLGQDANIDAAMNLSNLPLHRMGAEMQRLALRAAKDMAKKKSNAPAPIDPVNGSHVGTGGEPDPSNTSAWMKWRAETARKRR